MNRKCFIKILSLPLLSLSCVKDMTYSEYSNIDSSATLMLSDGNTVAWYDSTDLTTITKDGSNLVSRWNDKLGSGHDLLQATGTNQPLWSADGVLFDGVDNFMKANAFTYNQPCYIYGVIKAVTWTQYDYLFDGNTNDTSILYQLEVTPKLAIWSQVGAIYNPNINLDTWVIIRAFFNGVNSKFGIDKIALTGNPGTANMGGFTLGGRANGAQNGNYQVKELILRNVADNATNENIIYEYLDKKYSVSPAPLGGVWEKQGTVLVGDITNPQAQNIYEPFVLYETGAQILSGTVFKMWYSGGYSGTYTDYAESSDGINWTKLAGNHITGVPTARCPDIIKVGATYYLYSGITGLGAVDLYTSSDGVTWTLDTEDVLVIGTGVEWDATVIANKSIIIKDGTWYMFYEGANYPTSNGYHIGLATSPDGVTWTKYGSTHILPTNYSRSGPQVIKVGSFYYMWCHGINANPASHLPSDIVYRYKSSDLINWTQDTTQFGLIRTTADEGVGIDVGQVADPHLIEIGSQVYLFYSATSDGNNSSGHLHMKLAIADMTLAELVLTNEGNA